MPFEEQIKAFRTWATSLGCPPSAMPSDDALKYVFKSPNKQLFMQLQARIRAQENVRTVRENLLIAKMVQLKGKVVPVCERSFLPREMQTHLRMQDLLKKKEKAKEKMTEEKKECDNVAAIIKNKNIQITNVSHKNDVLQSRHDILELKLEDLNKKFEQEQQIKQQIIATMPVKLSTKNASERLASKDVEKALKELGNFYNICNTHGNNAHQLVEAKTQLWSQMREIFGDTPNVLIFNVIMKMMDKQLEHVMNMNKKSIANQDLSKPKLDNFDVKLLKTKGDLFGMAAKYVNARNEVAQLEERFAQVYGIFVDELQKKVNNFNGITSDEDDEGSEDIISDFILQFNMRNFYQSQNEFLTEQIEKLRMDLVSGAKQLENHEMLLGSIREMYRESNIAINRIHHDMEQMSQIKEKILYNKNIMKNMLNDMTHNTKSQFLSSKLKGNMSLMSMESSFCLTNDNVLSSTKLDIDANTSVANSTLLRSLDNTTLMPGAFNSTAVMAFGSGSSLPCHLIELNTFAEIPLEKLSCIPSACSFLISANPLIVESQELASTVQLAPGHLLTPYGALQEVNKRILWASAIAALSSDLKLNLKPLIVDPHNMKLKARRQHDEIVQLLDNIKALGVKGQLQLQKVNRIYHFAMDNALHKYVPPKRTFNGACFADYESEFNLYYRIATSGGSKKK
ncbi:augmin complex subunit dgt5 [Drosophila nasuta]|uniref:augmin complex subunit dgt5 n=1 Tax=Drosophila nasuta TaxID=42062 RepID=UPI00295F1384|nr:augmin complex subunit dgt5 [Drosophila nasuta]